MSVIIELSLPHDAFMLGRILPVSDEVEYSLEAIVPLREAPIPLIRVHEGETERLVSTAIDHPHVKDMEFQTTVEDDQIYSIDWDFTKDEFLKTVHKCSGHVLSGESFQGAWEFTLQFPDHDSVSAFEEALQEAEIENHVLSVGDQWVAEKMEGALTDAQREALAMAYRNGYYDIPRRTSTNTLSKEFGISDQAMTKRLRRGINSLIEAALPGLDRK